MLDPGMQAMANLINCQQRLEQLMNKGTSARIHPVILHLDQLVTLFVVLQLGQMVIHSVCDSSVGSDGDSENDSSIGSTSATVQPTPPPRRRYINSNMVMMASILGPKWTRRVDRKREARKHS
eukprot:scaffold2295_cov171-Chaetoceros_neogracile.AAC.5